MAHLQILTLARSVASTREHLRKASPVHAPLLRQDLSALLHGW